MPDLLVAGSLVFRPTRGPVNLNDYRNWWHWTPGAYWRRPEGPESNVGGRELHPVVHIAYADALAYARWAGKELPGEAEWERAARGGLDGKVFAWGDEFAPKGRMMANTWQGEFPWQNLMSDGFAGTSPIRRFAPNGFGLYDMTGNTWEWTSDWFSARAPSARSVATELLCPREAAGSHRSRQLRRRRDDSAEDDQGRLAPVRAELLPALSPRRPAGAGRRLVHFAHRLSMRDPGRVSLTADPDPLASSG